MIHMHGGSELLNKLRAAGLPGDFLKWCDVLCQGPAPARLSPDAWRRTRADFLERELNGNSKRQILDELETQDRALEESLGADELVLWFGPELFCQTILLYLLNWFGEHHDRLPQHLSLVCIDRYPGVDDDRGCTPAFLSPPQLRDVFARRTPLGDEHFTVAREAWRAFTDEQPSRLAEFSGASTAPLTFLGPALRRHLAELPAPVTGLSLTERRVLEALARGTRDFDTLFAKAQRNEERRWLTDTMLLAVLHRLATGTAPLVELQWELSPSPSSPRELLLTTLARDVLAGRRDWIAENGIDRWVGGVHLTPARVWRWDARTHRVVAP